MPMYDWTCAEGHEFEHVVKISERNDSIECSQEGCEAPAVRTEISVRCPAALLDYGFGLNREALNKGTYDPLNPIKRGVRRHRGEKAGPFG